MIVLQVLIGLLGLGLMVFIHEAGHFLAARAVGIDVEVFSIGWGPKLWSFRRGKTEYRISWIPIGGYCKMKGEKDMADALTNKTEIVASEGSFYAAKPWRRIIVAFAGPFVNLLFAVIVMTLIWWVGYSYKSTDSKIVLLSDYPLTTAQSDGGVKGLDTSSSPASRAGLHSGDRIVSINGEAVNSFRDLQLDVTVSAHQELKVGVDRNGSQFTTTLVPLMDPSSGAGMIGVRQWIDPVVDKASGTAAAAGIQPGDRIVAISGHPITHMVDVESAIKDSKSPYVVTVERNGQRLDLSTLPDYSDQGAPYLKIEPRGQIFHTPQMGPFQASARGTKEVFDTLWLTVRSLGLLFQGLDPTKAVSGPVRITYFIGEVATQGFSISFSEGIRSFFHFLALISIALFFGNLLPIPALDGGQILLFLWESIRRRPVRPAIVQRYQVVGAVLVFGLLILAVSGDVLFLFGK